MATKVNAAIVRQVADLIATNAQHTLHDEFFYELDAALNKLGYKIEAHQQGVRGTIIRLTTYNRAGRR